LRDLGVVASLAIRYRIGHSHIRATPVQEVAWIVHTRANLFPSQLIGDDGVETQKCFNMSFAGGSADVNQC
jgi:hypothetical protein